MFPGNKPLKPAVHSSSKNPKSKPHEYSPKIGERRRALFPSNNNSSDDGSLEGMTPIAESCSDDALSPEAVDHQNFHTNNRVRTVLFSDSDLTIPTRSFYKSSASIGAPNQHRRSTSNLTYINELSPTPSKPHPRHSRRSRFGEINAGVKHKIRKPKKHEVDTKHLLKAAEDILDNSPLNDFLDQQKVTKEKRSPKDADDAALCEYIKTLDEFNIVSSKNANGEANSTVAVRQIQPAVPSIREGNNDNETYNKKRSPSPLPESDQNRKFFKNSRVKSLSAVRQINLGSTDAENVHSCTREKSNEDFDFDHSDLDGLGNELIPSDKIDAILDVLGDKENIAHESIQINNFSGNRETYENMSQISPSDAGKSVGISSHQLSALMVENRNKNMLMSPTTQMCDMTSILAINSPMKARNLTKVISGLPNVQDTLPGTAVLRKFKSLPKDQMLLDAGQKNFGVIECPECKFIYHVGDADDEVMHSDYHTGANTILFSGWKNERVVWKHLDGSSRILQILPPDPKPWKKKILALLKLVNIDLGYFDMGSNIEHSQVFIYVKGKMIVGCLVAEHETTARKMLDSTGVDLCSEEEYPIKCGVSRIWVSEEHRHKHIATELMDSLKRNFMHGYMLINDDIAFSSPSELGKQFATNYFKTPNFFIYGV